MSLDALIGIGLVVLALAVVTVLTLWSRRTIHRIAEGRLGSARRIVRALRNES